MILCEIKFRHYSPKDSEEGIKEYVIADTAQQIEDYVDKEHLCGELSEQPDGEEHCAFLTPEWVQRLKDRMELLPQYGLTLDLQECGNTVAGSSQSITKWLQGTWWIDITDAYYGVTHYDWSKQRVITELDESILYKLGLAKDIRGKI
jgi:hypothetical protein